MVMDMDLKERNKGLAKKKKALSEAEKRIAELDNIFKRLYEDNISGKLTDERFRKLSQDYEDEQSGLKAQVLLLREEIEAVESRDGGADKILDYADRPSFCLYSSGLSPPREILIRFSRYQTI